MNEGIIVDGQILKMQTWEKCHVVNFGSYKSLYLDEHHIRAMLSSEICLKCSL